MVQWRVEPIEDGWGAVNEHGRVANEHVHKERKYARHHAAVLNALHRAWGLQAQEAEINGKAT